MFIYSEPTLPIIETVNTTRNHFIIKVVKNNIETILINDLEITQDDYSFLLSQDQNYLVLKAGSDVYGYMYLIDVKTKKTITFNECKYQIKWNNNHLYWTKVLYKGDGYAILEDHDFVDGNDTMLNQYVGGYHGGYFDSPFSKNYNLNKFKSYKDVLLGYTDYLNNLKNNNYFADEKLPESMNQALIDLAFNKINIDYIVDSFFSKEVIENIINYSYNATTYSVNINSIHSTSIF